MIVTFLNGDKYNTSKVEFKVSDYDSKVFTIQFNINDNVNDTACVVATAVKSIEEIEKEPHISDYDIIH